MSATTIELKRQIAALTKQLEKAIQEEETLNKLPLNHYVAILIHGRLCNHNHTDGCGWYYEVKNDIHDFAGSTHSYYVKKADKVIESMRANCDIDEAEYKHVLDAILSVM